VRLNQLLELLWWNKGQEAFVFNASAALQVNRF
jgi:membrane-bound inhibitor of C-type lysozyme